MKMNRGLVMTLCAAALAAGSLAQAQTPTVNLSLNLRYTNPSVPSQGGTWYLVGKTTHAQGIAAVNAYISGINTVGIVYGTPATNFGGTAANFGNYTQSRNTATTLAAELTSGGQPFVVPGAPVNIVYFQDTANGPVSGGVGTATYGDRQAVDPLRNTTTWNNATVIASGTFGATRPAFATKGGNSTDANVLATVGVPSNNAIDANVTTTVRGDSVVIGANGATVPTPLESPAGAGLRFGDRNRNGSISFLADISPGITNIGTGSGKTWEDGDFNGNGTVSYLADISPAISQIGLPATPAPAIGAIPEPGSLALAGGLIACLAGLRRRS